MFLNISGKYQYKHKVFLTLKDKIDLFHWKV